MRLQTMNYNDTRKTIDYSGLLNDLQLLVNSLNDTIRIIETGAPKTFIETCLHCDGDALNHIRVCLHNGGYDND